MPTNLYGENDNFHPQNSHVIPALMRRIHEAKINRDKSVVIWGTGNVRREFLHVDDMACASIFVMNLPKEHYAEKTDPMLSHINIGTGEDVTIAELAFTLASVIGYSGELEFDATKPEGTPRKLLDAGKLTAMGWDYKISLKDGLARTYHWYRNNINIARVS
jgi:GDP-L-fucose synthase